MTSRQDSALKHAWRRKRVLISRRFRELPSHDVRSELWRYENGCGYSGTLTVGAEIELTNSLVYSGLIIKFSRCIHSTIVPKVLGGLP
jgi:hypothetical protein